MTSEAYTRVTQLVGLVKNSKHNGNVRRGSGLKVLGKGKRDISRGILTSFRSHANLCDVLT